MKQVHDKSGKKCYMCKEPFTDASFNIPISEKKKGFIIKHTVCGKCHNSHFEQGE